MDDIKFIDMDKPLTITGEFEITRADNTSLPPMRIEIPNISAKYSIDIHPIE